MQELRVCEMWTVDITQDMTVIICRAVPKGATTESGENACMSDSETYRVGCHDIQLVSVGLAISASNQTAMHQCTPMGYMLMRREDKTIHRQPFLVIISTTDCIMSLDAIALQITNCVRWRHQGHVE